MNIQTARDWWECLSRDELQARVQQETPRMCNSKIGQWQAVNAELDAPRRTRRAWHDDQGDER